MKKILLCVCLSMASLVAFAQLPSVGIKGGVNFAKLESSSSASNLTTTTGSLTSFSVSLFTDIKFGNLSLQPAISYTGKGGQIDVGDNSFAKVKLYYLQVPVNIVYHIPAVIGHVYVGAGPYVGEGISGKTKISDGTGSQSEDVKFGSGDGEIKSTDFGLNAIAGFQFKTGLLVGLNYDLGLSNLSNEDGSKTRNRVLGISVGFVF